MRNRILSYRKNFTLIVSILVLISVSLVAILIISYSLTKRVLENEFTAFKVDVLDQSVKRYNTFFHQKVPEISFYQGFLDSTSASQYADTILKNYPIVERILFYDAQISNREVADGLRTANFSFGIKGLYQFKRNSHPDSVVLFTNQQPGSLSLANADEFNKIGLKVVSYISGVDTTRIMSTEEIFKVFYNVTNRKITYMNVPRREDIKVYKELMFKKLPPSPLYEQDVFSFELNPYRLRIVNPHPNLYQHIVVKPVSFETAVEKTNQVSTDIALPWALSEYKLYLSSDKAYLQKEVWRRFFPIGLGVLSIYFILAFIVFLISRNLIANKKLFGLQYDFINNFSHEFKTPVSVIKIAGNNILSASELDEKDRKRYGKILDEEADKLNDLMNKLLSFTQIENKAIEVKHQTINLEVFVQNIIDTFQLKYPDYDIELDIKDVESFKSDPVLLSSIFYNLIENAYKYADVGSKFLKIGVFRNKKNIVFSFKDKGIGIEATEQSNIFKKFYRIQSRYNQQGSVGLGLAFCKELAIFMNGNITVKSSPGKGSTFEVTLPYEKP